MKKQGSWLKWEGVQPRSVSWSDMWRMDHQRIGFLLFSVYDVLPMPVNLQTWKPFEDPTCKLCGRPARVGTYPIFLQNCTFIRKIPMQHDKIFSEIAARLDVARKKKPTGQTKPTFINFVQEGGKALTNNSSTDTGLLAAARDWELLVDLKGQLKFLPDVATTTLHPDVLLLSRATKKVVLIELTVPFEERIEEPHERKKAKYQQLLDECRQGGWKTWNLPVEVGSWSFAGLSRWRAFGVHGITGMTRRQAIEDVCRRISLTMVVAEGRAKVDSQSVCGRELITLGRHTSGRCRGLRQNI